MTQQRQGCHSTRACARHSASWAHCAQHSCKAPAQSPRGKTPGTKAGAKKTCLATRRPLALPSHMCPHSHMCTHMHTHAFTCTHLYQLSTVKFRITYKPYILV